MIDSSFGVVHLTRPNYQLCETLHLTKAELDNTVKHMLGADTTAILGALSDCYGVDEALKIWYECAETFIRVKKGEL